MTSDFVQRFVRAGTVRVWLGAGTLLAGSGAGCDTNTAERPCPVGSRLCPCTSSSACDPGLVCVEDLCIDDTVVGETQGASSGDADTGASGGGDTDTAADTGSSDTTGPVEACSRRPYELGVGALCGMCETLDRECSEVLTGGAYCYFSCEEDADCACDPAYPYCRSVTEVQDDLSMDIGTWCVADP